MHKKNQIELVLFENDALAVEFYNVQGIRSFIVDLEYDGKDSRQKGFNTEINCGSFSDLKAISRIPDIKAWCRINRYGPHTHAEVKSAIDAGADVLILPMVTRIEEVERFIKLINSQCETCIMIETADAVSVCPQLNKLPLNYAFFGLNDFAICRGDSFIFRAVADGTVETVRRSIPDIHFGFGGLTNILSGSPIPSKKIVEELCRLDCGFTFLRRSFRKDSKTTTPAEIISGIFNYWEDCCSRSEQRVEKDHAELVNIIMRAERFPNCT